MLTQTKPCALSLSTQPVTQHTFLMSDATLDDYYAIVILFLAGVVPEVVISGDSPCPLLNLMRLQVLYKLMSPTHQIEFLTGTVCADSLKLALVKREDLPIELIEASLEESDEEELESALSPGAVVIIEKIKLLRPDESVEFIQLNSFSDLKQIMQALSAEELKKIQQKGELFFCETVDLKTESVTEITALLNQFAGKVHVIQSGWVGEIQAALLKQLSQEQQAFFEMSRLAWEAALKPLAEKSKKELIEHKQAVFSLALYRHPEYRSLFSVVEGDLSIDEQGHVVLLADPEEKKKQPSFQGVMIRRISTHE